MREPALLSRRAAAALPLAALFGPAAAAVPPSGADADLVDLGRRWEAALATEEAHIGAFNLDHVMTDAERQEFDAIGDELYDARSAIFRRIETAPATTSAGLAVKARVLAYENGFEMDEASIARALAAARYFSDRAALSLALDCLRMARIAA